LGENVILPYAKNGRKEVEKKKKKKTTKKNPSKETFKNIFKKTKTKKNHRIYF